MSFRFELPIEERLFQASLALDSTERRAFIHKSAEGDQALEDAVLLLIEGYEESGGDEVEGTLSGEGKARRAWAASTPEEPGTEIDHFRLVRRLGQGGMGTVWEAEQSEPVARQVALKVIKLGMDTVEVIERFERERRILAQMNHPHIAQVYEAGATELGRPYFAMELVSGEAITKHCKKAQLSLKERLDLFIDVCQAVEHAHLRGCIHRDLKPSNICVNEDGQVKVIDFGIAKAVQGDSEAEQTLFTQQSQVLGTPAYMSPEQASARGDLDTRTDVYSLGVLLYELITDGLPFDPDRLTNSSAADLERILCEEAPPTPSTQLSAATQVDPSTPRLSFEKDLDWIVLKALSKERERRYASAAAFAKDVQRYLDGEAVEAVPPTLVYKFGKFVRRNKLAVAAATAVVLSLVTGLAISIVQTQRAEQARLKVTHTVADLFTRSGLAEEDPTIASLWFAKAAVTAADDPARVQANLYRASAWRQEARTIVQAFETGFEYVRRLEWHPKGTALIATAESLKETGIWHLASAQQWRPSSLKTTIRWASWSPSGEHLAVYDGSSAFIVAFPSGEILAQREASGFARLHWHPDGALVAVPSSENPFVWEWQSDQVHPVPSTVTKPLAMRFSGDGERLLISWERGAGVCHRDDLTHFLHEPVPSLGSYHSGWLGQTSDLYYVEGPNADLEIRDAVTGDIRERHGNWARPLGNTWFVSSPDGRYLSQSQPPCLDRQSELPNNFPQHGAYLAKAFDSKSRLLATGGRDERLLLWSLPDGELLGSMGHPKSGLSSAAFSPDDSLLAAAENGLVRVFNVALPQTHQRIPINETSLAKTSPDGKTLLVTGHSHHQWAQTKTVTTYDIDTCQATGTGIALDGLLMNAAFSTDASWVVAAVSTTPNRETTSFSLTDGSSGSGYVQRFDPKTGTPLGQRFPMPSEPRGVCVHPMEPIIAVCCAAGETLEISYQTGEVRQLFDHDEISHPHEWTHNGRCRYAPDGKTLAVWGLYTFLHVWDRVNGKHLLEPHHPGHFPEVDFSKDVIANTWIDQESYLQFRNARTGQPTAPSILTSQAPWLGRFNRQGNHFLVGGTDDAAEIWDWRNGKRVGPVFRHESLVSAGAFVDLASHPWVATGDHQGTIHFWDYTTGMAMRPPLTLPQSWLLEMNITSDGQHLIACHQNGIDVIDLKTTFPAPPLEPEGALLLAEIDAASEIHESGGIVPLTNREWLARLQIFQRDFPEYQLQFFNQTPY